MVSIRSAETKFLSEFRVHPQIKRTQNRFCTADNVMDIILKNMCALLRQTLSHFSRGKP